MKRQSHDFGTRPDRWWGLPLFLLLQIFAWTLWFRFSTDQEPTFKLWIALELGILAWCVMFYKAARRLAWWGIASVVVMPLLKLLLVSR
jgi:hypothetical protein